MKRGYYQFAGGLSSTAVLLAVAVGTGTAAFIAFVYTNAHAQLAPLESTTRWLELAITPVMSLLAATATGATLHGFKVRSRVAMTVAVLGATAGAIAISWHTLDALHTDEVGVAKPQPAMYTSTAFGLDVKQQELFHIGDLEPTDVQGALAVGAQAGLFGGDNDRYIENSKAHYVFTDWSQFIDSLPAIFG